MPPFNKVEDNDETTRGRRPSRRRSSASSSSTSAADSCPIHCRRRVWFNLHRNQAHFVTHLDDMTDCEVRTLWYSDEEMKDLRRALTDLVQQLDRSQVEEVSTEAAEGLHIYRSIEYYERQAVKDFVRDAVILEQERQSRENIAPDPVVLGRVAALASSKAMVRLSPSENSANGGDLYYTHDDYDDDCLEYLWQSWIVPSWWCCFYKCFMPSGRLNCHHSKNNPHDKA